MPFLPPNQQRQSTEGTLIQATDSKTEAHYIYDCKTKSSYTTTPLINHLQHEDMQTVCLHTIAALS